MAATKNESRQKPLQAKHAKGDKGALPLWEQAYVAIKDRITLLFAPGQYLNEASICEQLG